MGFRNVEPYTKAFGTWRVTTEGDCEGKSVSDLGTHTGNIDEIALALADKCYYSLKFHAVTPLVEHPAPTKTEVSVSFDIDSGTWDMTTDERMKFAQSILKDRPVTVSAGHYYASFKISVFKPEQVSADIATRNVLAKLTLEDKKVLGLE